MICVVAQEPAWLPVSARVFLRVFLPVLLRALAPVWPGELRAAVPERAWPRVGVQEQAQGAQLADVRELARVSVPELDAQQVVRDELRVVLLA